MAKEKLMLDLFEKQLQNLFNSETLILKELPHMLEYVTDDELKGIVRKYTHETYDQLGRLEDIGEYLNIKLNVSDGNIIRALLEDVQWLLDEFQKGLLMDAGIVSNLQQIEHFQISAYETALLYSQSLDLKDVSDKLNETLDEAYQADEYCSKYVKGLLLNRAR